MPSDYRNRCPDPQFLRKIVLVHELADSAIKRACPHRDDHEDTLTERKGVRVVLCRNHISSQGFELRNH